MSSDLKLLLAAQAAGSSKASRDEFAKRFCKFLKHCAARHCQIRKLDLANVDDVVNMAIVMFFSGQHAQFNPAAGQGVLIYLEGLVRNAVTIQRRFVHKGASLQQEWGDPLIAQLGLPTCIEEVSMPERVPPIEVAEEAALALSVATPDELILIHRHFFHDESIVLIAESLGVARTTVTRRLERFYVRAAAEIAA